jgi:cell wall-active antibiotic response 4TMS protein YvqF/uncharacterized protein DUF1707
VQRLSALFAAGQIELEDLERRLDIAVRAQSAADLDRALAGLPDAAAPQVASKAIDKAGPARRGSRWTVAVLSGSHRRGGWVLGPLHRTVAFWGGAILDLRDATFTADVTHLRIKAVMGGVQVIVPPDLPVEVDGFGIMGAVDNRASIPSGAARVVIHAFALMGGVQVLERDRAAETGALPHEESADRERIEGS